MVVHDCDLSRQETGAGRLRVQCQPDYTADYLFVWGEGLRTPL